MKYACAYEVADAMKYAPRMRDLFHFMSAGHFIAKQLHIATAILHFHHQSAGLPHRPLFVAEYPVTAPNSRSSPRHRR